MTIGWTPRGSTVDMIEQTCVCMFVMLRPALKIKLHCFCLAHPSSGTEIQHSDHVCASPTSSCVESSCSFCIGPELSLCEQEHNTAEPDYRLGRTMVTIWSLADLQHTLTKSLVCRRAYQVTRQSWPQVAVAAVASRC